MRVIRDPTVPADVDVSACFDNAGAVNTNLGTGAVLPGQSPSDDNYYRFTDQLAKSSDGQWQVVSNSPTPDPVDGPLDGKQRSTLFGFTSNGLSSMTFSSSVRAVGLLPGAVMVWAASGHAPARSASTVRCFLT